MTWLLMVGIVLVLFVIPNVVILVKAYRPKAPPQRMSYAEWRERTSAPPVGHSSPQRSREDIEWDREMEKLERRQAGLPPRRYRR